MHGRKVHTWDAMLIRCCLSRLINAYTHRRRITQQTEGTLEAEYGFVIAVRAYSGRLERFARLLPSNLMLYYNTH